MRTQQGLRIPLTPEQRKIAIAVGMVLFLLGLAALPNAGPNSTWPPLAILLGLFWTGIGAVPMLRSDRR